MPPKINAKMDAKIPTLILDFLYKLLINIPISTEQTPFAVP